MFLSALPTSALPTNHVLCSHLLISDICCCVWSKNYVHGKSVTDLRRQEHEGGQVQQTLELAPGGLPAGGQQSGWWPVGEHHAQALAHQQLQVRRHLGHAEDPVLQAAHITGSLLWGPRREGRQGPKVNFGPREARRWTGRP